MATQTIWVSEIPAVNNNASFEIEEVTPAKGALDGNELCGSGLPRIVGNSAALRRVLGGAATTHTDVRVICATHPKRMRDRWTKERL